MNFLDSLDQPCSYSASGDQLEIQDGGSSFCTDAGKYTLSRSGDQLSFTANEDGCDGRRMELVSGPWDAVN